jgi:hypothetical protein
MVDNDGSDQLASEPEEFVDLDAPEIEVQEEAEVQAEAETSETSEFEVPEKFQGKSPEDIAKSYTELEREFGRKNNEIGELRKLTDQLLQLQVAEKQQQVQAPQETETAPAVDFDSLVENPQQALDSAVASNPKLKALEEKLLGQERQTAKAQFEQVHPDYQDVLQSNHFQGWLQQNPAMHQILLEADRNFDYQTGGEILKVYKDIKAQAVTDTKQEQEAQRKEALKAGASERGGTGQASRKFYRRADLINLKLTNPTKYASMLPEIERAYSEGRVK